MEYKEEIIVFLPCPFSRVVYNKIRDKKERGDRIGESICGPQRVRENKKYDTLGQRNGGDCRR